MSRSWSVRCDISFLLVVALSDLNWMNSKHLFTGLSQLGLFLRAMLVYVINECIILLLMGFSMSSRRMGIKRSAKTSNKTVLLQQSTPSKHEKYNGKISLYERRHIVTSNNSFFTLSFVGKVDFVGYIII